MSTETDVYAAQGFGGRLGFGQSPALLIVDFVVGFADPAQFGGGNIAQAIERTVELLKLARDRKMPIVHTRVVFADDGADSSGFSQKVPSLLRLTEGNPSSHIVPQLQPLPGEIVIRKRLPSAFAGTGLGGLLAARRVDTLMVAGCTTSGCVRASVIDAMGAGMRVVVARDCVGDRALAPHEANLFDMEQKYADVMDCAEIRAEIEARDYLTRS